MKRDPKRLKRILRVRELQEETARGAWMQAQIIARQADELVEAGKENILKGLDFVRMQQEVGSISGVLNADAAIVHLQHALTQCQATAAARHREVEAAKEPWIQSRRAARGIEKLFERAVEDQRVERLHKEDQALEESVDALLTRQKNNRNTSPSA
ncbi:MAG: hypothetical protein P1V35_01190 [Planctomycetota bacterium]|nr:hypothetical protein [Planctomycetota bacterium]